MKNNFINNLLRDPQSADYAGYGSIDEMYASLGVDASTVIDATPSNYDPNVSVQSSPNWWDTIGSGLKAVSPLLGAVVGTNLQTNNNGRTVVYSSNGATTTSKTTTIVLVGVLIVAVVVTVIVFTRKK